MRINTQPKSTTSNSIIWWSVLTGAGRLVLSWVLPSSRLCIQASKWALLSHVVTIRTGLGSQQLEALKARLAVHLVAALAKAALQHIGRAGRNLQGADGDVAHGVCSVAKWMGCAL